MVREDETTLLRLGRPFATLPMFLWGFSSFAAERDQIMPEVND